MQTRTSSHLVAVDCHGSTVYLAITPRLHRRFHSLPRSFLSTHAPSLPRPFPPTLLPLHARPFPSSPLPFFTPLPSLLSLIVPHASLAHSAPASPTSNRPPCSSSVPPSPSLAPRPRFPHRTARKAGSAQASAPCTRDSCQCNHAGPLKKDDSPACCRSHMPHRTIVLVRIRRDA